MKLNSTLIVGLLACAMLSPFAALSQCSLSLTYTVTESRCKSTGAINVTVNGGSGRLRHLPVGNKKHRQRGKESGDPAVRINFFLKVTKTTGRPEMAVFCLYCWPSAI